VKVFKERIISPWNKNAKQNWEESILIPEPYIPAQHNYSEHEKSRTLGIIDTDKFFVTIKQ